MDMQVDGLLAIHVLIIVGSEHKVDGCKQQGQIPADLQVRTINAGLFCRSSASPNNLRNLQLPAGAFEQGKLQGPEQDGRICASLAGGEAFAAYCQIRLSVVS